MVIIPLVFGSREGWTYLFSHEDLKVLVDNGHSQQNTSARPDLENMLKDVCKRIEENKIIQPR